jgi:cation-transporting ATPase E
MTTHEEIQGLTEAEVGRRQEAGLDNKSTVQTSRTYTDILRDNLFTFINSVYFLICLVLLALGRVSDLFMIVVVIALNVITNIYQEIRAKKKLDQIALLTRAKATVIREGQERIIDPAEIVVGDVLLVTPGDQIVVDGSVIRSREMKVDESLLTGESDLIPKQVDDPVYSGSFCVTGQAYYQVEKVGKDCLANQITATARSFRKSVTPLQQEINLVIRVLLAIAILLALIVCFRTLLGLLQFEAAVEQITVITGLVPSGLYLMITLAYALGGLRIAQKNALIQQANAIESLSNVDVMCLDKTGTLTANRILLESVHPIGMNEAELRRILGDYAASASASNRTNEAILQGWRGSANLEDTPRQHSLRAEVPFASSHKWSALAFADSEGVYVLGAPEILSTAVPLTDESKAIIQAGTDRGLRVLLFAYSPIVTSMKDVAGHPVLPPDLEPLGILQFSDELRPEARETLAKFMQSGIQVKIISGDNPLTVASLAKQAGLPANIQAVSGQDLAVMDEMQFTQTAQESVIFGRITPEQKARLVKSLRSRGNYVAMMGDGVNDVPSLKQADVSISMESGSQAARNVADIVLLKDSFSALPDIFLEGQRIRNGIEDVTKLFLVRVLSFVLIIVAVGMVTFTFPLTIKLGTLVTLFAVGIPTYFVTIWAKPGAIVKGAIVPMMLNFLIPATLTLTLASLGVYLGFLVAYAVPILNLIEGNTTVEQLQRLIRSADIKHALTSAQSALVTMQMLGGLLLLLFLKPPLPSWVSCEPLSRDWRYTKLAFILIGVYVLILVVPFLRRFFGLIALSLNEFLIIGLVALLWCLVLRYVWRHRLLERFLGVQIW